MKKLITIIFCLLVSTTMMGQDCLTFMGVPTKGNTRMIISKLNEKGFRTIRTRNNYSYSTGHIILEGMFCGELCDINMEFSYWDGDRKVISFEVTTHEHNSISKERAKKMYKSFKQYYNSKTLPSLFRYGRSEEVEISVVDKEGNQIGIVNFSFSDTLNRVFITYNNKPKKTFHKCDEHCDGYWMEEFVSVK